MKEIKVKESIPIGNGRIVQHTMYVCESCGNTHISENFIGKCPICGKDTCVSCECDNPLLDDAILAIDDWGASFILQDNCNSGKYRYICTNCMNKLRQGTETYLTKAQILIDKFNQDIATLTKRFIEEHKELKDEN